MTRIMKDCESKATSYCKSEMVELSRRLSEMEHSLAAATDKVELLLKRIDQTQADLMAGKNKTPHFLESARVAKAASMGVPVVDIATVEHVSADSVNELLLAYDRFINPKKSSVVMKSKKVSADMIHMRSFHCVQAMEGSLRHSIFDHQGISLKDAWESYSQEAAKVKNQRAGNAGSMSKLYLTYGGLFLDIIRTYDEQTKIFKSGRP